MNSLLLKYRKCNATSYKLRSPFPFIREAALDKSEFQNKILLLRQHKLCRFMMVQGVEVFILTHEEEPRKVMFSCYNMSTFNQANSRTEAISFPICYEGQSAKKDCSQCTSSQFLLHFYPQLILDILHPIQI